MIGDVADFKEPGSSGNLEGTERELRHAV